MISFRLPGFSKSKPKTPPPRKVIPVPDDSAAKALSQRKAAKRSQTSGAVSTVLSGGGTGRLGA